MTLLVAWLFCSTPDIDNARHFVAMQFQAVGRQAPVRDSALDRAASKLAQEALERPLADVLQIHNQVAVLSEAGIGDPSPTVITFRDISIERCVQRLKEHKGLVTKPATHMGVGLAEAESNSILVLILTYRKIKLLPFASYVPHPNTEQTICFSPEKILSNFEVARTSPAGEVETSEPIWTRQGMCTHLRFLSRGRHIIEILGRPETGVEVLALVHVQVGSEMPPKEEVHTALSPNEHMRQEIVSEINRVRENRGVKAIQLDENLTKVANEYAQFLSRRKKLVHTHPDGQSLSKRLLLKGISFSSAGENLALGANAREAHATIAHSPAHLRNLMNTQFRYVGIGIAQQENRTLVVEIFIARDLQQRPPSPKN